MCTRAEDGELIWDEEDGDDLKILGAYSSEQKAQERLARARELPGFREEPDCFLIDFLIDLYTLDEDRWSEGFISVSLNE